MYVKYISLTNGKIYKDKLDKFFSEPAFLRKFSCDDCSRLGFFGAGKLFLTNDNRSTKEIIKDFKQFVDDFNSEENPT